MKAQIPKVFGKLLYGSKFHPLKQQRGQQGIGVSAAGMYGQLTTGKPVTIRSRTSQRAPRTSSRSRSTRRRTSRWCCSDEETEWEVEHGTRVEIELEATYKKGRRSVDDYVEQTALANPHAEIRYRRRAQDEHPATPARVDAAARRSPREIKPHPYGVELGRLLRMLQDTPARNVSAALKNDFSRVTEQGRGRGDRLAQVKPTARPSHLIAGRGRAAAQGACSP